MSPSVRTDTPNASDPDPTRPIREGVHPESDRQMMIYLQARNLYWSRAEDPFASSETWDQCLTDALCWYEENREAIENAPPIRGAKRRAVESREEVGPVCDGCRASPSKEAPLLAINERDRMIQKMMDTFYHRHAPEELENPLSAEEMQEHLHVLNERWRTSGDIEIDESMVREARKRAGSQRSGPDALDASIGAP